MTAGGTFVPGGDVDRRTLVGVVIAGLAVLLAVSAGTWFSPTPKRPVSPIAAAPAALEAPVPVGAPPRPPPSAWGPSDPDAPRPAAAPARPRAPGDSPDAVVDERTLRPLIEPLQPDLSDCFRVAREEDPAVPHAFAMTVYISPYGSGFGEIEMVKSPLGEPFDSCASRVVTPIKFPARDETSVEYNVAF
jgi:hypothetical protein